MTPAYYYLIKSEFTKDMESTELLQNLMYCREQNMGMLSCHDKQPQNHRQMRQQLQHPQNWYNT